jgi:hypothetical protein
MPNSVQTVPLGRGEGVEDGAFSDVGETNDSAVQWHALGFLIPSSIETRWAGDGVTGGQRGVVQFAAVFALSVGRIVSE